MSYIRLTKELRRIKRDFEASRSENAISDSSNQLSLDIPMTDKNTLICDKVHEYLKAQIEPPLFSLGGPVKAAILKQDNTYSNKPFGGSEEFFFKGLRAGKRAEFILEFEPVDSQPFKQMEMPDKPMTFDLINGLESFLIAALQIQDPPETWQVAKVKFHKQVVEEVKVAEKGKYERNPQWGTF